MGKPPSKPHNSTQPECLLLREKVRRGLEITKEINNRNELDPRLFVKKTGA